MIMIPEEAHEDADGPPAPFVRIGGDPACGLILLCDHASNRVPGEFGDLGLSQAELKRHIAFDPGAAALTRALAARLAAPAILTTFSRLVIDPNRGEDDPTLLMRLSDGTIVPGNVGIGPVEKERRLQAFHRPYHAAVDAEIDQRFALGIVPALVSIHSFTPAWRGRERRWHAGILWDGDPRLAEPLIAALARDPALIIGDNEPYVGALRNDTLYRHATRRGLAHALIELRQDEIADERGVDAWADRLAAILGDLDREGEIHKIRHHGSRTGPVDPIFTDIVAADGGNCDGRDRRADAHRA